MTTIIVAKDGTDNYSSIQPAINAVNPGDIIQVKDGLYPEKVTVNEQAKLYAQSKNTIIDGSSLPYHGSFWEKGLVEIIVRDRFKRHPVDLAGENKGSHCDGICPNGKNYDVKVLSCIKIVFIILTLEINIKKR